MTPGPDDAASAGGSAPEPGPPAAALPLVEPRGAGSPGRGGDGIAVLALVLAVVSWVTLPVVLALVALVLARSAERSAGADRDRTAGLVTAARWVAWIQLVVVAMLIAFVGGLALALWLGR